MILAVSIALVLAVLLYVLLIRPQDLPFVEPQSPTGHLDERKAAIYENIRDANFEFLMGKLSQEDYQQTKADLQQELNEVNAEIQVVLARLGPDVESTSAALKPAGQSRTKVPANPAQEPRKAVAGGAETSSAATLAEPLEAISGQPLSSDAPAHPGPFVCGNCGASFPQPMRFCGACGKPMGEAKA